MPNLISFGDLKASELPSHLNLCPDSPSFAEKVNRTLEWILNCGSFNGTVKHVHLCIDDSCIVMPPYVANLNAVRACGSAVRIESNWDRMLPGWNPGRWRSGELWFEYRDQVPSFASLCSPRVLRSFVASSTDRGKKAKFIGYDKNKQWVRTSQGGIIKDGEVVIFTTPFADTVTEWTSVTAFIKDETDAQVTVFSYPFGNDSALSGFGTYQHWETKPSYQRYRIDNAQLLTESECSRNVVEAEIKLCHIPVKNNDDLLPIGNRVAMEMAVMGVKALDDGDLARSDALLFGDANNKRLGAIPLLNQEIQTVTGDRFAANVRIGGPCGFKTIVRGFI